jgi:hypothetical protein
MIFQRHSSSQLMDDAQTPRGIWIDGSATLCERNAQDAYHTLICSQLWWSFPEFVYNLQNQTPHEREMSRVAVIEYRSEAPPEQKVFKSSEELHCHFEKTATTDSSSPRQRLFVLEDLSLNAIEVLGSHLRIPPSFFGAHWADPATPTFNHRNTFCRYSESNFVVRYPSTQPIRIDASPEVHGTIFRCNANVDRHIHCYDPKGPLVDQPKSYHALSFWTSGTRDDGSWDCEVFRSASSLHY